MDVLIDAVKQGFNSEALSSYAGVNRTMVFANTVDAVESIAKILHQVGVECICYHSSSSLEERTKNLSDFLERGGVLVCTDAAARGLDIPNVSHVVQVCIFSLDQLLFMPCAFLTFPWLINESLIKLFKFLKKGHMRVTKG